MKNIYIGSNIGVNYWLQVVILSISTVEQLLKRIELNKY